MPTYITLYNYKGPVKGGGPERFKKVNEIVAEEKGEVQQVYGLLGPYDAIAVSKFPDNRAAMKSAARVGNLINANTLTMAAIDQQDFIKLLSEL